MDKVYDHKLHERDIYAFWEKGKYFEPKIDPSSLKLRRGKQATKPFTIIMPPPNANDPLHIGHARFVAIEDTLIRYHRMKGEPTLWLPGADHAGIETQFVFEKKLAEQGKSRFDFDRETLFQMIWDYVQENKGVMEKQLRVLGASCDWTRNKFTLDLDIKKIVYKTFKKLSDDGLIYRSKRLVNYCTFCGTGYSNLEVDHIERTDPLYYLKYGPFTLATVRPETKFGDTAVAVNPKDKRYLEWVGKEIEVEGLIGKFKIKVVADEAVDPEFGTGVVKVTPAHDFNDFEIGERHSLEVKQVINPDGKLNELTGKYAGLFVNQARKQVAEDLKAAGLLEKVDENYKHSVGVCYRCKNTIEPMLAEQWFVKIKPLADVASKAVKDGKVKFAAKRFEKIALHWLKNLYDWNISRQIVWGMAIPAWQCQECHEWVVTEGEAPTGCSCGSRNLVQDPDTFDTWFSSGQWPFAVLRASPYEGDFEYFYPTSVMETAYDILPFWVLRMIMLGLYATGDVPFENVLIHGLVRDSQGQKISKSKGNVIDPIEMAEKYGTDALRMGILWGALVESDVSLSENNIKAQRNFSNKVWNAARFVLYQTVSLAETGNLDKELKENLETSIKTVTDRLDQFRINEAVEWVYSWFWHSYCDRYIELAKKGEIGKKALTEALEVNLKLLYPFMPFITETIWQKMGKKEPLIVAPWPEVK